MGVESKGNGTAAAVVMVRGPAAVSVRGRCQLLGMDVSNQQIRVRVGKVLPFEPAPDCALGIDGGEWWEAGSPSAAGTSMWEGVAGRIVARCKRRAKPVSVMVVGATDVGKSTFCAYLANRALRAGIVPCVIIDGDIGQGDLAPPSALGAAVLRQPVADLRDAHTEFFEFVGDITPSSAGTARLVASKMRSLLRRTRGLSSLQIINTDGYVADGGAAYKRMLARALRPDVVVAIGGRREAPQLQPGPWLLLRARRGGHPAAAKSRSERIARRLDQYLRYVGQGSVTKSLDAVRFMHASGSSDAARRGGFVTAAPDEAEDGMFVALGTTTRTSAIPAVTAATASHGEKSWLQVVGFGIIDGIDKTAGTITIKTGLPPQRFDTICQSSILLLRGGMGGGEARIRERQEGDEEKRGAGPPVSETQGR
jgi:polynucleotide 5'-hydroxyl-kinase GRC3/NOL9